MARLEGREVQVMFMLAVYSNSARIYMICIVDIHTYTHTYKYVYIYIIDNSASHTLAQNSGMDHCYINNI